MKAVAIVLLVKHLTAGGLWVEAPPADMDTMWQCNKAKAEVEEGFRVDAVPDKDFEVRCKRERWVEPSPAPKDNSESNTSMHTVLD